MKIVVKFLGVFVLLFSQLALAGSGKAIVPHWAGQAPGASPTVIYLSNISNNNVDVTVTFYDKMGVALSPTAFDNFISSNTQIAAGNTGNVQIKPSSFNYGYAVIEWKNEGNDDDTVALVAHGYRSTTNSSTRRSDFVISVNNGLPF
ncbi:MAG: hypothetical protein ACFHVJ_08825 [Aestuariibacter sp.]